MAWTRRPLKETEHRALWDLEVVSGASPAPKRFRTVSKNSRSRGFHPPMLSFEWTVASILASEAAETSQHVSVER